MRDYFEKLIEIVKSALNSLLLPILIWIGFFLFGFLLSFGYAFVFSGIARILYYFNQTINQSVVMILRGKVDENPIENGFVRLWLLITGSVFLTIGLAMVI